MAKSDNPNEAYPYTYLARRRVQDPTGDVVLYLIADHTIVDAQEGDEFFTIRTAVPMFDESYGRESNG